MLQDVVFDDLQALVEFIYHGEVNVHQRNLSSFLKTAEVLRVSGLTQPSDSSANDVSTLTNIIKIHYTKNDYYYFFHIIYSRCYFHCYCCVLSIPRDNLPRHHRRKIRFCHSPHKWLRAECRRKSDREKDFHNNHRRPYLHLGQR